MAGFLRALGNWWHRRMGSYPTVAAAMAIYADENLVTDKWKEEMAQEIEKHKLGPEAYRDFMSLHGGKMEEMEEDGALEFDGMFELDGEDRFAVLVDELIETLGGAGDPWVAATVDDLNSIHTLCLNADDAYIDRLHDGVPKLDPRGHQVEAIPLRVRIGTQTRLLLKGVDRRLAENRKMSQDAIKRGAFYNEHSDWQLKEGDQLFITSTGRVTLNFMPPTAVSVQHVGKVMRNEQNELYLSAPAGWIDEADGEEEPDRFRGVGDG